MNREWVVRAAASAAVTAAVGLVWAQQPGGGKPADLKGSGYTPDANLGAQCLACHRTPLVDFQAQGSEKFVLLRETAYWSQHDLHRRAFDVLSSTLGEQMSQLLFGDPKAAATRPACLVCHATDTAPAVPLKDKTVAQFNCNYGVNCQSCHGPAESWRSVHQQVDWREKPPAEKAKLGQVNLRHPSVRAEKCVGCHVGSAAEGKFVTHDMYAAGHPPLPAFELATFSRDEVRHWRSPVDVPYITGLKPDDARTRFSYRKGEVEAARLAAVGAVVCFRESVALLQAPPQPGGLDFSHFNCAACHHELRVPSDRQTNGFPGFPGRPVPQTWPVWMTRAVIDHAAPLNPEVNALKGPFAEQYDQLRAAFDARPFGDPDRVAKAAGELVKTCNALLAALDKVDYTEPTAWGLLGKLAETATAPPGGKRRDFLDPDAAGQIARASAAIYADLAGGYADPFPPPDAPPAKPPGFDRLKTDPKGVAKLLAELNGVVPLAVRDDYHNGLAPDGKPLPKHERFLIQHPDNLGRRLEMQSKFKSDTFRDVFTRIAGQLGRPPG